MAIKVKITKEAYGHKPGQVLELSEFEAGHLMGFGFAVPYVEPKVENAKAVQPEVRILVPPVPIIVTDSVTEKKEPEKPSGLFGRRGRRKKI